MVEICPVLTCEKKCKNKNALLGHIRLTKDVAHQTYYNDHIAGRKNSLLPKPEINRLEAINTKPPSGDLKSILNGFIQDKDENRELCASIKKLLEEDDTRLKILEEKLEKEYGALGSKLEQEYKSFETNYMTEKNREYAEYKKALDKNYNAKHNGLQNSVNSAKTEGQNEQTVWVFCNKQSQMLPIHPNTETGDLFLQFLDWLGLIFPVNAGERFRSLFIDDLLQQNYACNNENVRLNDELRWQEQMERKPSLHPQTPRTSRTVNLQDIEQLERKVRTYA